MKRATILAAIVLVCTRACSAQNSVVLDLTQAAQASQWRPAHDVSTAIATPAGLKISIMGGDPYLSGPAVDLPAKVPLWLDVRLLSDQGGSGQLFYFSADRGPTEERSVRFPVRAGQWEGIRVPLPPLGPGTRLRFDPPGSGGTCTLARLAFEPRNILPEPTWPKPQAPRLAAPLFGLSTGGLSLVHGAEPGGFKLMVDGQQMATGNPRPLVGYLVGGAVRWIDVARDGKTTIAKDDTVVRVVTVFQDADGASWAIRHELAEARVPGVIEDNIAIEVTADRDVAYLPLLTLLPGFGSFSSAKDHALFGGLEYLDGDEPSSSEKDIEGSGARREIPDTARITVPIMVVQAHGRYVGLAWKPDPLVAAAFDSPDRILGSGAHMMGIGCPGSDGSIRDEGSIMPYSGQRLAAGKPLTMRAWIIGGVGDSVIPAVIKYVGLGALPPIPESGLRFDQYVRLAADGWLDSKIREHLPDRNLYRHAWPGDFKPQPAADAAIWMTWLAEHARAEAKDSLLAARLEETERSAIGAVSPDDYNDSSVGHVRYPLGSLIFGDVPANVRRARQEAQELLNRFEPDGTILYHPAPGGLDYGRTHFARDANGLTAQVVARLLELATVCGDQGLVKDAIGKLRALEKFANQAPRGAQTWEVPLHTPDILAAAHLLRAYTLGYEVTGDEHLLNQARYWAWTGVPFVYLWNPTGQAIGPYATTAVFGATQWKAPDWMGLPVQWCGLVYADALYRFAPHDLTGPWKTLADGITASGLQQTWPIGKDSDRVGLLPDSFNLRGQIRNDSAINPATLLANAVRFYRQAPIYSLQVLRTFSADPVFVHAPGNVSDLREAKGRVTFRIHGWPTKPYFVLVSGLHARPAVRMNGAAVLLGGVNQYDESGGFLTLRVTGRSWVTIEAANRGAYPRSDSGDRKPR